MKFVSLSRSETTFYKGVAILMIVIHNFMHLFPNPREMEFEFYSDRFGIFLEALLEPSNLIRVLFSYFGHFGVQIFIFLSAYGLTKRYLAQNIILSSFFLNRIKTIYPSFLLAILLYASTIADWEYGILAPLKQIYWFPEIYIYKVLLISNFIPGQEFSLVGPWWFISFIFQFYLIYPILLKLYNRWNGKGLFVLSISSIIFNQSMHGHIGPINLYLTVVGHLPEFCLGIYFAKKDLDELNVPNYIFFLSVLIFYLGNIFEPFWYLSHLSFLFILLTIFNKYRSVLKSDNFINSVFLYLGNISMPLFLVNGFLREPFLSMAKEYNTWLLTIFFCFLSFFVSILVATFLGKTEKLLVNTGRILYIKYLVK